MGAKEVAAGAAWLDKNFPGWERKIDLTKLDIGDGCNCVIGQTLGFFRTPQNNLRDGDIWAEAHGFLPTIDYSWTEEQAHALEAKWADLIKERFNTGNLSNGG